MFPFEFILKAKQKCPSGAKWIFPTLVAQKIGCERVFSRISIFDWTYMLHVLDLWPLHFTISTSAFHQYQFAVGWWELNGKYNIFLLSMISLSFTSFLSLFDLINLAWRWKNLLKFNWKGNDLRILATCSVWINISI